MDAHRQLLLIATLNDYHIIKSCKPPVVSRSLRELSHALYHRRRHRRF